jgi:hypothetical protein
MKQGDENNYACLFTIFLLHNGISQESAQLYEGWSKNTKNFCSGKNFYYLQVKH